jgi:2-haloacid dehalogenase
VIVRAWRNRQCRRIRLFGIGEKDVKWFAAAHMWDVTAATKVGFRGAWSSVYENEACLDIFDDAKLEVVAGGLLEMAQQIVEKS